MNLKDVRNLDKDELLGLLVGAGIALMLAPKPGHELRQELRDRLRRGPCEGDIKEEATTTGGAKAATNPQA